MVILRDDEDQDKPFMDEFNKAAEENKGKMLFTYSNFVTDLDEGIQHHMTQFLGVTLDTSPQLWAIIPNQMLKFQSVLTDTMTAEQITEFIDDVLLGRAEPFYKSQEPPAE